MKATILSIFSLLTIACNAQITAPFVIENYHELAANQTIKLKDKSKTLYQEVLLKGFIQQENSFFCYPTYENYPQIDDYEAAWNSLLDNFQLVDLDDDGDLDLVFSGKLCQEQEIHYLMVFMCDFKNYKLALFTAGKPVLLNDNNELVCFAAAQQKTLENTIKVFQFQQNRAEERFEITLFDSPSLRSAKKHANYYKNWVPKKLDAIQECEIPSGTTTYFAPFDSIPSSELIEKSSIQTLHKTQKVTVFNHFKDKKQQSWKYIAYQEESNPNSIVMGWIKDNICQ